MATINLAPNQCRYTIVTGKTLLDLENNINNIIAQGWNAERFIGGVGKDDNGFFQTILLCPGSAKDSFSITGAVSA